MTEVKITCMSCKKRITNTIGTVRFPCPKCGEYEIIRCMHCRQLAAKYKCANCSFEGPN